MLFKCLIQQSSIEKLLIKNVKGDIAWLIAVWHLTVKIESIHLLIKNKVKLGMGGINSMQYE